MALNSNVELNYQKVWKSKLPSLQGKEEEIINLHVKDKVSLLQLSKMYNCDRKPIRNIITKNGGTIRPTTSPELEGREEEILKMYLNDLLTVQTIRKEIGCTYNSIKNFLKRNKVELRTAEESRNTEDGKVRGTTRKLQNPEDLQTAIDLYYSGKTLQEVGDEFKISPVGLRIKFLKNGVTLRTLNEIAQSKSTQDRKKQSYLTHYGVENPMQDPSICERSRSTTMDRWVIENPTKNPTTANIYNQYKFKVCDIHGKKFTPLQGYEPQGIIHLIEQDGIDVNDIFSGRKVPSIIYTFEGKQRMYFPDLFVKSKNLLIEVKCGYTYNNEVDKNIAKQKASKDAGYNHMTLMFDPKGKKVVDIF